MATKTPGHHISQNIEYPHYEFGEAWWLKIILRDNFFFYSQK